MIVYLVQCEVCENGSTSHYIEGIFSNVESACNKMKSEFEIDACSENGIVSHCFEEGVYKPEYDDDYCEVNDNSISLYSTRGCIQYDIWIEIIEVED